MASAHRQTKAAEIVVVGAGALGLSTALQLARREREVLLVDKAPIGSQTSPRAAGFASSLAPDPSVSQLRQRGIEMLKEISDDPTHPFRVHQTGGLKITMDPIFTDSLERDLELARDQGVEAAVIEPAEVHELAPWIEADPISFATFTPSDLYFDPPALVQGLEDLCVQAGVRSLPNSAVTGFRRSDNGVSAVETSSGLIEAQNLIITAGAWTFYLTSLLDLDLPTVPHRHQLFCTDPLPSLVDPDQPTVRIMDANFYARPDRGGLLAGGYEPNPLSFSLAEFDSSLNIDDLPIDVEGLRELVTRVATLIPCLVNAPVREARGGLPTLTADGRFLIDRVPTAENVYCVTGCNVGGLVTSPSVGEALADWVVTGERPAILDAFGVGRFDPSESESDRRLQQITNERYANLESIN